MQSAFHGIRHYAQQKRLHVIVSERGLNYINNTEKKNFKDGIIPTVFQISIRVITK